MSRLKILSQLTKQPMKHKIKTVTVPIGKENIDIKVPERTDVLSLKKAKPLLKPSESIHHSLNSPIDTKPMSELAKGCRSACIVVSDNTRPVPYKGPNGILPPILETLQKSNINKITILIACGTHRPMAEDEIKDMVGDCVFQQGIEVINHVATDESALRNIGSTQRTTKVTVNRHYLDADLKIATGLVEPHFMAGFSGGRKAICPGICGQDVTYGFHSVSILADPNSTSLNLYTNPCHDEAVKIAQMAGVDFIVNVIINSDKQITGVFSGNMQKAHDAAIIFLKDYVSVSIEKQYDVVITQAGDVGVNHYQCAKAAIEASRAVKKDGKIILLGNLTDPDPIGSENYKQMLKLLADSGHKEFISKISSSNWTFVPEQWQVQMWARVFEKLGTAGNFFSCMPQLENAAPELIPEIKVCSLVKRLSNESDLNYLKRMAEETLSSVISDADIADVLILPDGPYVVPIMEE